MSAESSSSIDVQEPTIELNQNGKLVRTIGANHPAFVIAEIGQNHQGSLDLALNLIKESALAGADCVKFQHSCLEERFTRYALDREYKSPHSFGQTYREHRMALSLTREELAKCQQVANNEGILFSASGTDRSSLTFLAEHLNVPFLKIGSGDSNNMLLIDFASEKFHQPLIISTGMVSFAYVIDKVYSCVLRHRPDCPKLALLHCVSSYPTKDEDVNLALIPQFKKHYPKSVVGYSGHELGTEISLGAVALGAKIIERHVTFDNNAKGSDHKCSLLPNQLKDLVTGIRRIEKSMGCLDLKDRRRMKCELPCFNKLGKVVVASKNVRRGDILTEENLDIKAACIDSVDANLYSSSSHYIQGENINAVFYTAAEKFVPADTPLRPEHLYNP